MADEPTPPENPEAAAAEAAPEQGTEATTKRSKRWPAGVALAVLAVVLGLEGAGLLLRDSLENRLSVLAEAPAVIGESDAAATVVPATARFGPEVREVAVAAGTPQPPREAPTELPDPAPAEVVENTPPEPEATNVEPAAVAAPALAPAPAAEPAPAPALATATTTAEPEPPTTATHALQVGVFGSQKYRHAMEQRLEEAGLPYFRREKQKSGMGYRLAVPLNDAAEKNRAVAALAGAGYVYRVDVDSLEAIFHFEAEAQRALQKLSAAGLKGGYGKITGQVPLWVVYAGPFPREQAKQVRQQLALLGLPSYLRKVP